MHVPCDFTLTLPGRNPVQDLIGMYNPVLDSIPIQDTAQDPIPI